MAHPYAGHKDHRVSKHRVGVILKSGKTHSPHTTDKGLFKPHMEAKMSGEKSSPRMDKFARGGAAKGKKGHVHINILNVPHGQNTTPSPMGLTGAAPPPGGLGPPIAPPQGMGGPSFPPPQAAGMGAPMPPMGHKRGGRIEGEANAKNLKKWAAHASSNSPPKKAFARGGRMPPKLNKAEEAWAGKAGGSDKTMKSAKITKYKTAGQGSGTGLIEYAKHMKKSYP
jgi:hypothetical protein